jgi:hypothetical protein
VGVIFSRKEILAIFDKGLNLRKWTDTIVNLIDVKKKKNVLYKKVKIFVL